MYVYKIYNFSGRFNVGQSIATAYRKKSRGFINNFMNAWFREAQFVPSSEIKKLESIVNE